MKGKRGVKKDFIVVIRKAPYKREVRGRVITYKQHEFGFPDNEPALLEITELHTGSGFNGNGKRNLSSVKAAEKRIGEKKFWEMIDDMSIEDRVKALEAADKSVSEHNRKFPALASRFTKLTGMVVDADRFMALCGSGKKSIDIFSLERRLRAYGYDDNENISMKDFIEKKWGREAMQIIEDLL